MAFELPPALITLNLAHMLTHARFRKWRRLMTLDAFLFKGIANPSPPPVSILLLAAPRVVLAEIAEVIVWANNRQRARIPDPWPASPTTTSRRSRWTTTSGPPAATAARVRPAAS